MRKTVSDLDTKKPVVRSISRAAAILNCLSNNINTVTEIARHCRLSLSTVHRLLEALEETELAYRDPRDQSYHPGYFVTKLSLDPLASHKYLLMCADNEIKRLSHVTEETVALYILPGIKVIRLHEITSRHYIRVIEEDRIINTYAGANAHVLLSQLKNEEVEALLKNVELERFAENTITDKTALMSRVEKSRENGYSISIGEWVTGAICISVPIRNYICPATLSIIGPEYILKPKVTSALNELMVSSKLISDNLGSKYT